MAGFVNWLRQQVDRADSVGALAREHERRDAAREVWLLEELRARMQAEAAPRWLFDALANATVEWGSSVGITVRKPAATGKSLIPVSMQRGEASGLRSTVLAAAEAPSQPQREPGGPVVT